MDHPLFAVCPFEGYVVPIWLPQCLKCILQNGTSTIPTDRTRFNAMKLHYKFQKAPSVPVAPSEEDDGVEVQNCD